MANTAIRGQASRRVRLFPKGALSAGWIAKDIFWRHTAKIQIEITSHRIHSPVAGEWRLRKMIFVNPDFRERASGEPGLRLRFYRLLVFVPIGVPAADRGTGLP